MSNRSLALLTLLFATSTFACSGSEAASDDSSRESDQALTTSSAFGSMLSCVYGNPWKETEVQYTQYLFFAGPDNGSHVLRRRNGMVNDITILDFSLPYDGSIDVTQAGHFTPSTTPRRDGLPGYTRTVVVPGVDAFGKNANRAALDDCSLSKLGVGEFFGNANEKALLGKRLHCTYNEGGLGQGTIDATFFAGPDLRPWAMTSVRQTGEENYGPPPAIMVEQFARWQTWMPFSVAVSTDPDPTINKNPMLKLGKETFDVTTPTHPGWLDKAKPPRSFELRCSID